MKEANNITEERLRRYVRASVADLEAYAAGGAADAGAIKISANENAYGTPPEVCAAVRRCLDEDARLNRYPDSSCVALRGALSAAFDLPADCFIVGNGLDDVINTFAATFFSAGDEVVIPAMSFVVYESAARAMNATPVRIPMRADLSIDLDAMRAAVRPATKAIFLCTPNNPTGTTISKSAFAAFMDGLNESDAPPLVVVDHAYLDYEAEGPERLDAAHFLGAYANLVVLRTFSKISGLAGLRVGYAAASPALLSYMYRIRPPYTVGALAQAAAVADVSSPSVAAFKSRVRDAVARSRAALENFFRDNGISYIPSQANFVFAMHDMSDDARGAVVSALAERGILVRSLRHEDAPNGLRFSIGTEAENAALIEALSEILNLEKP